MSLIPRVSAKTNYTIQVGGANGAGGPLNLLFDYFPDTDGDGILDDAPDKCRTQPGHRALRRLPAGAALLAAGAYTVRRRRAADHGPRRSTTCPRARAPRSAAGARSPGGRRAGHAEVAGCVGRTIGAGEQHRDPRHARPDRQGQYRYGAVGKYYRWPVSAGRPRQAQDELPAARLAQAHEVPMRRAAALRSLAAGSRGPGAARPSRRSLDFEASASGRDLVDPGRELSERTTCRRRLDRCS